MKRVALFTAIWISSLLTSCKSTSDESTLKDVIEFNDVAGMALGSGLNSLDFSVKGDCVLRTPPESALPSNSQSVAFALEKIESFQSLSEKLNVKASARVSGGIGSASAKASFVESQNINMFSVYILAKVIVSNVSERMRDVELKPNVYSLLSTPEGKDIFRERCGDEFIIGQTTGGEFFSLIEIKTNSTEQKREIESKISGKYGAFSAKGSFQQTLSEISKISTLNVFVFQKGGDTSTIKIDADSMIQQAVNFPGEVEKRPYPYLATTAKYSTLDLPASSSPIDIKNQQQVIDRLADEKMRALDNLANISYVLGNQNEFENVDLNSLNIAGDKLRQNINAIHLAASQCNNDLTKCTFPANLSSPEIKIPSRIKGEIGESTCKTPVYNSKSDPICGADTYNVKTSPACGVALYMEGNGAPCGVATYKLAATPECGVHQYNQGTSTVCGVSDESRVIEVDGDRKLLWRSHPENLAKGNELCKGRIGTDWEIVNWEHPPRPKGFFFTRNVTCKRAVPKTCRNATFGIESYKSCRHAKHGVESTKTCRHPSFGIQSYNACANESHGVATYKSCANPIFGFKECAD